MILSDAERALVDAAAVGEVLDLTSPDATDPAGHSDWGTQRDIRASVLEKLCDGTYDVHRRGVRLHGARIVGTVDLTYADVPDPLELQRCALPDGPLILAGATIRALILDGCHLIGATDTHGVLDLDEAAVGASVSMAEGFRAAGPVLMSGAKIGGQLRCTGATLDGDGGPALDGDGMSVDGDVFLDGGFSATGTVRLPGAQISGQLNCTGATLDGNGDRALVGDGLSVDAGAVLTGGFSATGTVRLLGAQISGQLACRDATLDGDGGPPWTGTG